ncbi:uncharacterized protein B0J15DRAFT_284958 [Neofusicoccum parvum]|uniref:Uncharacterized protein B0J15DRAFT_284958 n=1 Tax=Neofusicoccum parvum TaxID=310453 RepID=A0ACB5S8U4_9PEZI|nr:uncharacterized protein B0J15DRAFT_284958 [Neofusicoccum parvum]
MAYPRTYRAYRRTAPPYPLSIALSTETLPESLGPHDVLVRIRAVSLNFRDVAMLHEGRYPVPVETGGIPASDCAAEVVAVGDQVKRFGVGDRVAPTVNSAYLTGEERDADAVAPGGNAPGVLREYGVFEEKVLVMLPRQLSWEEASTIPCAGLTAWKALDSLEGRKQDATALLQGTGGVSMFALVICLAAGIKPIITSSSDSKLEKVREIGPEVQGINYKTHTDVAAEALSLTGGRGVDFVINNIGPSSIPSDLTALRKKGGTISLIGFLEGIEADWSPSILLTLMIKAAKLQGILAGSRKDFEDLNKFLEEKNVQLDSIIDRTYAFEDCPAAFEYLYSGKHVGKVVIKL